MYNVFGSEMEDKEGSRQTRPRIDFPFLRTSRGRAITLSLLTLLTVTTLFVLEYYPRPRRFVVGKPSTETVISSRDFSVLDEENTERLRDEERRRVMDIFVDREASQEALSRMEGFFARVESLPQEKMSREEELAYLRAEMGEQVSEGTLTLLLEASPEDSRVLYAAVSQLISEAMSHPVSYDNLDTVRARVSEKAQSLSLDEDFRVAVAELSRAFITTNTAYAAEAVERDMEEAAKAVQPVYAHYVVGQKIVDKGEIITPLILASLGEAGALSPMGSYQQVVAVAVIAAILYLLGLLFLTSYRRPAAGDWRVVAALCVLLLTFVVLGRLFSLFADENPLWGYLVPLALVGLSLAALLDNLSALVFSALGGAAAGILLKGNFPLSLFALLGGIAGSLVVRRLNRREDLFKAAVQLSLFLGLGAMATASLFRELRLVFLAGALGVGNGVLCTLLTLGMLPVLERISGLITPMHLLELASPDHPLMRLLISKAPGTYSHSIVVGNLAEAAAQAVGADPLLARVGSYYHDVGKVKRSWFFVENQPQGFNGHDKLKPNLSALVITAHVREGVELAREHRLPHEVVDIIQQHHGTSLIRYFYAQALRERGPSENITESRFRYPGLKPQSKEAAIVMLADAVEAAAKAVDRPTPVKLEQIVKNLIKERLDDNQLSESNLTLGDLEKITVAFTRILCGMYHERVEYPTLVKEGGA